MLLKLSANPKWSERSRFDSNSLSGEFPRSAPSTQTSSNRIERSSARSDYTFNSEDEMRFITRYLWGMLFVCLLPVLIYAILLFIAPELL